MKIKYSMFGLMRRGAMFQFHKLQHLIGHHGGKTQIATTRNLWAKIMCLSIRYFSRPKNWRWMTDGKRLMY